MRAERAGALIPELHDEAPWLTAPPFTRRPSANRLSDGQPAAAETQRTENRKETERGGLNSCHHLRPVRETDRQRGRSGMTEDLKQSSGNEKSKVLRLARLNTAITLISFTLCRSVHQKRVKMKKQRSSQIIKFLLSTNRH